MANVSDLKITRVKIKLIEEIQNISDNIGLNRSQFLKMKLKEISDSYTEDMKKKKKTDQA